MSLRGGEGRRTAPRGTVVLSRAGSLAPLAVVAGVALAAVLGVLVGFRVAGLVVAAVLTVTALARWALPAPALGALAVRSRAVDVVTCLVLGTGVAVLALTAPS